MSVQIAPPPLPPDQDRSFLPPLESMKGATRGEHGSFVRPKSPDLSPLDELINIVEGGQRKDQQEWDSEDDVPTRAGVMGAYVNMQRAMSAQDRVQLDTVLTKLHTVFIQNHCEAEGDNVAHNVGVIQHFFQEKAALLRTRKEDPTAQQHPPHIGNLYEQFIESKAHPQTIKNWGLNNNVSVGEPTTETNSCEPPSPQVAPREEPAAGVFAPDKPGGPAKKNPRRKKADQYTKQHRSRADFEQFLNTFAQMEACVWETIRLVACDTSLAPQDCTSKMVEIVLAAEDSPWWGLYRQLQFFKQIGSDYDIIQKQLQERTQECAQLREENILNTAFLSGDMAEGLVDEIQELRSGADASKRDFEEITAAVKVVTEECERKEEEAAAVFKKVKEAMETLKALHAQAAEAGCLFPKDVCMASSEVAARGDRQLLSLQPDCGAPSSKRCPACLAVCTVSPFCPVTGGKHNKGDYPSKEHPKEGTTPAPLISKAIRPLLKLKQKKKLDASVAVVALIGNILVNTIAEPCPCGSLFILRGRSPSFNPQHPLKLKKRGSSIRLSPGQRRQSRAGSVSSQSEYSCGGDEEAHTDLEGNVFILLIKELCVLLKQTTAKPVEVTDLFSGGDFGVFAKHATLLKKLALELIGYRTDKTPAGKRATQSNQRKGSTVDSLFVK